MNHSRDAQRIRALGSRVRALRDQRGLGRQALAERAGIAAGDLERIERGDADPPIHVVWQLAATLNVPLSELVTGID